MLSLLKIRNLALVDELTWEPHAGFLGITGETVTTFYQLYYNLPNGLYISQLEPGCDAEKQGLRPGDILLSIGDSRIVTQTDLDNVVYTLEVGEIIPITVYRDGKQGTFYLTVEEDKG